MTFPCFNCANREFPEYCPVVTAKGQQMETARLGCKMKAKRTRRKFCGQEVRK